MSLVKVKLRYTTRRVGQGQYQVVESESNAPMWQCKQELGESVWFNVMTAAEAEKFIEELIKEEV